MFLDVFYLLCFFQKYLTHTMYCNLKYSIYILMLLLLKHFPFKIISYPLELLLIHYLFHDEVLLIIIMVMHPGLICLQ